jgi:hypothetical protein
LFSCLDLLKEELGSGGYGEVFEEEKESNKKTNGLDFFLCFINRLIFKIWL